MSELRAAALGGRLPQPRPGQAVARLAAQRPPSRVPRTWFAARVRGRARHPRPRRRAAEALTELPLEQLTPLLRVISDKHKHLVMNDRQVSMNVLRDFLLSWRRKSAAVDARARDRVHRRRPRVGRATSRRRWRLRALDAFAAGGRRQRRGGARGAEGGVASTSGASAARNNPPPVSCARCLGVGHDHADAPETTGRRASVDAARYAAAKNSGFYGTSSTAAGASAAAAPGSSAPPVASPSVAAWPTPAAAAGRSEVRWT